MKRIKMLALASVLCAGALGVATPSMANHGGCHKVKNPICPAIFAPVVCDNGKTYSNSCFAAADCATGCVSAGPEA
jgi:Kazal-type serine protease inhibitor domain